jgi:tungstate transport system substrate-binding protein
VKGLTDVAAALTQIAGSQSPFISRGDDSGTHTKEVSLWQTTALTLVETPSLTDPAKVISQPDGEWYQSVGQGMGATLTIAAEQQGYTLSDRATFLARSLEGIDLEILVEGDSRMFNPYGVIAVNPEVHPMVNTAGADAFIEWITSVETQQLISQFGVAEFGQSLFVPDSADWNAAK